MRSLDVLRFSIIALRQHRRRTLLSLLGVTIGVTAVIFLTGLAEGARRYVVNEFAALGSNILIVIPGKTETTGAFPGVGKPANDLTLDDTRSLARSLRGVRNVVPVALGNDTVSFGERRRQILIVGTSRAYMETRELSVARGSFIPEADLDRGAPVGVLGSKLARELFAESDPLGQVIRVGGSRMRVIGVLEPRGEQLGQDVDDMVYAPVATVMQIFNRTSLFRLLIELETHSDVEHVKRQTLAIIEERHEEEDITLLTQDAVLDSLGGVLQALTLALGGIGGISIAVAGIGIMNVMLVAVSERRAEVGLLKAVGAKQRQILAIFLMEAALLSSAGGLIGLVLGLASVQLVAMLYPALPAATPLWAVTGVLGLAMATGPLFGVIPAWRASRLDPVTTLSGGT